MILNADSGQDAYSRIKRIQPEPSRKDCVQLTLDDNLGNRLSSNEPNLTNSTINAPQIEITHKLFDTHYGLVEGISYTGKKFFKLELQKDSCYFTFFSIVHISLPMPGSITDICIVITSDDSYIGMFENKSRQSRLQSLIR